MALEIPLSGVPIVRGGLQTTIESLNEETPDLTIEAQELAYLIDTGTQITSFHDRLTEGSVAFFRGDVITLETLTLCAAVVKGRALSELEQVLGVNIDALIGQSILMLHHTYIDFQERRAWIYPSAPDSAPPGMEAVASYTVPVSPQNQFPVAQVGFGATLSEDLVGEAECPPPGCCTSSSCPMMMDTGSEATVITQSLFDQIEVEYGESLPRLSGYPQGVA